MTPTHSPVHVSDDWSPSMSCSNPALFKHTQEVNFGLIVIGSGLLLQEVMSRSLEPWSHVSTASRPQPDAVWVMCVETASVNNEDHE